MKPKQFKEANRVFAKDQPEYNQLPVFMDDSGQVVSCWRLSFSERLRLLFKGELWLCVHTFNRGLSPLFLTTKKKELIVTQTAVPDSTEK